jgi:hypothetical protein
MLKSFPAFKSPPALACKGFQLEPQIFRQPDESSSILPNPQQRVDAYGVRRHELIKLDERRAARVGAGLEQIGNLGIAEAPCEVYHPPAFLKSDFDPARHVDRRRQKAIRQF